MSAPTAGCVLPWNGEYDPFAVIAPDGLPTWRFGGARRGLGLATRRQLRDLGLSIGRQQPCARIAWGRPAGQRIRWANLYRIDLARPRRRHTAAAEDARQRAMLARRTCTVDGHEGPADVGYCVARVSLGGCVAYWEAGRCVGTLGPPPEPTQPVALPTPTEAPTPAPEQERVAA